MSQTQRIDRDLDARGHDIHADTFSGLASGASVLVPGRTINGVHFDGSADIETPDPYWFMVKSLGKTVFTYTPPCLILPFRDSSYNPADIYPVGGSNVTFTTLSVAGFTYMRVAVVNNPTARAVILHASCHVNYANTTPLVKDRAISLHLLASPYSIISGELSPYYGPSYPITSYPPYAVGEVAACSNKDNTGGGNLSCSGTINIDPGTTSYIYGKMQVTETGGDFRIDSWSYSGCSLALV